MKKLKAMAAGLSPRVFLPGSSTLLKRGDTIIGGFVQLGSNPLQESDLRVVAIDGFFFDESDSRKLFAPAIESSLRDLDGMFSVAIFDKTTQRLICARDRAAQKPLFYSEQLNGFYFASNMRALLAGGVPAEIDWDSIRLGMLFGTPPRPHTSFAKIRSLQAGEYICVEKEEIRAHKKYYDFSFGPSTRSEREALETFEALLSQAVRKVLPEGEPIAVLMSGGIDSTTLAAIAQKEKRQITAFTLEFSEAKEDALAAKKIANFLGIECHTQQCTPEDFFKAYDDVALITEEPVDYFVALAQMVEPIARQGFKLVLNGGGGDDALHGMGRDLLYKKYWSLSRYFRGLGGLLPPFKKFEAYRKIFLSDDEAHYFALFNAHSPAFCAQAFDEPTFADPSHFIRSQLGGKKFRTGMEQLSYLTLKFTMENHHNEPFDRLLFEQGLEPRYPFYDHRYIEFCLSLPEELTIKNGKGKYLLRKLSADFFPPALALRSKRGFGVDARKILLGLSRHDGEMAETFRHLEKRGFFKATFLRECLKTKTQNFERAEMALYLYGFEKWCEWFIDGSVISKLAIQSTGSLIESAQIIVREFPFPAEGGPGVDSFVISKEDTVASADVMAVVLDGELSPFKINPEKAAD